MAFLFEECRQLIVAHIQAMAVYPCKVGAFRAPHLQRSDGVDLVCKVVHVCFDVDIQLVQPLVALGVSCGYNRVYESVCTADVQVVQQSLEAFAQVLVLDDDVGCLKAGKVEGFTWSSAQDSADRVLMT